VCDTLAVVGSGRVLFAKNSDRDPNEAQALEWHPRRDHAPGSRLRCTWIEIPAVRRTHAVLLSRPFWMWGAEMGANEHGVVIGNEAVFTRHAVAKTGLTGMDLVRLALERAATAAEACDVITELLGEHGQGGGCGHESKRFCYHNSFLVADPTGAFVLETAGKETATQPVRGVRSISNGLTIPGFAERHSDRIKTRVSGCRLRRARTQALAEKDTATPRSLFALLRDHGPQGSWPRYSWVNGGLSAPCVHAGGLVAASQTTASWVADLRPGNCLHWVTATSTPCTALFKPVRVEEPLPPGPAPTDRADEASLWWRHERFARRVMADPQGLAALFCEERDRTEEGWLANPPAAAEAFARGDELLANWSRAAAAGPARDGRPFWVRRYWARRNRWAGLI
jgi:dipeptidase